METNFFLKSEVQGFIGRRTNLRRTTECCFSVQGQKQSFEEESRILLQHTYSGKRIAFLSCTGDMSSLDPQKSKQEIERKKNILSTSL